MITWPALEHAAQQAGWRRQGKAWRGPCPLCGGRKDRAWVGPGTTADFVADCNGGCDGLARALVPDSDPSPVVRREPRTRAARAPATTSQGQTPSPELPAAVWRAAAALRAQPAATYLAARGLPGPWPVSVLAVYIEFPAVPAALPAPECHVPRSPFRREAIITARAGHRTRPVIFAPDAPLAVATPTTRKLADASISVNTRRAYAGALRRLDAWRGAAPVDDARLAVYLGELFEAGRAPATAALAVAAVRFRAKLAGQPAAAGEATARVLGGYRRTTADRGRGQAAPLRRGRARRDSRHRRTSPHGRPGRRIPPHGAPPGPTRRRDRRRATSRAGE